MPTLDTATLRMLAVRASCDTRTIQKVIRGEPVRGLARYRIAEVLRTAGIAFPEPPAWSKKPENPLAVPASQSEVTSTDAGATPQLGGGA